MIRLLFFFIVLGVLAYGGMLLVQHPGHVSMNWFGYQIETSAALLVLAVAVAAIVAWIIFRVVVGLPSFMAYAARQRRREKGYAALSRGLVAVGAGDARAAGRASAQANRRLKNDPLALVLRAQAARLSGDDEGAVRAFQSLAQREDTRILGLRGLYAEASRRGDENAASQFAAAAHKMSALPWSAQAVLDHRARAGDWQGALASVEESVRLRLVDKATGQRQRAVLETAIADEKQGTEPDVALALAQAAIKRAPDLAPPVVLAARLLGRRGDIRKASKLIERAWPKCQHPDIAQAYMDVRPGDSTSDRLARAKTLMGIASFDPVSRMTVARAALANKDFAAARSAMEPLVAEGRRPTIGMCRLMAEIEEAEHGDIGQWREWLARASRAALDPAWIADGIVYDAWGPVSPTTGHLDAFRWQVPAERLGPAMEAMPASLDRGLSVARGSNESNASLPSPARPADEPASAEPMLPPARPTEPDVGAPAAAELAVAEPASAGSAEPGEPSPVRPGSPAPERLDAANGRSVPGDVVGEARASVNDGGVPAMVERHEDGPLVEPAQPERGREVAPVATPPVQDAPRERGMYSSG